MHRQYLLQGLFILFCLPSLVAAQSAPPATVVRARSSLVIVDVTVTDGKQNPVHNLTAGAFKIFEDGHLQTIKNFEEHTVPVTPPPIMPVPKLEEGTYTNFTPAPASGPLNILLLDMLNTPMADQAYVRIQLLKYLQQARPGTSVAIFGLGTRLFLIKGFSSDLAQLRTAMAGSKTRPNNSPLIDSNIEDDPLLTAIEESGGSSAGGQGALEALKRMDTDIRSSRIQLRVRYTLDALNQMARYLGGLPGRKNLIWFSASFPVKIMPDVVTEKNDPFMGMVDLRNEYEDTVAMLARSQVAVYPVDSLGLRSDTTFDPASDVKIQASSQTGLITKAMQANIDAMSQSHDQFTQDMVDAHGTMKSIAEATGGKAFFNSNDLTGAVEKAVADGANYYTLTYIPANPAGNGSYRKIKVELMRKGLTLAYRQGYYIDDRQDRNQPGKPAPAASETAPYNAFNAAMLRGAPEPSEIIFIASARPSTADAEPEVVMGNKIAAKVTGPFRRYTVRYNCSSSHIDCPLTANGVRRCALEFTALVYDSEGALVNNQTNAIKADLTGAEYQTVQDSGLQFNQEISVPVSGDYSLRLGILDLNSGRVGALELPIADVAKLAPVLVTRP